MDDEIVTLAQFSDPFEAERVKSRLEEEGIRVFQSGEESVGIFGGLGGGFAKIQLHVTEADLKRAMCILSRPDDEEDEYEPGIRGESIRAVQSADDDPREEGSTAITGEAPRKEGGSDAIQDRPRSEWAEIARDADEEDEPEVSAGARSQEESINRAWRASIVGLFVFPGLLHLYSVALLLQMGDVSKDKLTPRGEFRLWIAKCINALVLGAISVFLLSLCLRIR